MKAPLALLFLACLLAQGLCRKGRKIVFDTSTELPEENEYSDAGSLLLVLMSTMKTYAGSQ